MCYNAIWLMFENDAGGLCARCPGRRGFGQRELQAPTHRFERPVRQATLDARSEHGRVGTMRTVEDRLSAHRALGGEMPFRLLDTEVGTTQVEEVLGRIEYGIVA
jgi:Protein of unknown function (DUF2384)